MKASISGHSALFVLACIFVWATIFLSCLAAIAQTDPGAGADKSIGNAFVPVPAQAPRKALVIVAGKYANGAFPSLPSAKKDFDKMSEKLRDFGFHDRDIIPSLDEPAAAVVAKNQIFSG